MKKLLTWLVVLGALGGGGYWWFAGSTSANATSDLPEPEVITVERGSLRVVVQATGKVVPNATVEVKSKASGEIIDLPFQEGDTVQAGDLLVELDPDDEQRNVQRAESNLSSQRARLEQARRELTLMESDAGRYLTQAESNLAQASAEYADALSRFERRQGLREEGVLNQEEYDAARTAFEQARTRLINAQANFDDAQNYPLNIEVRRQSLVLAETQVRDSEIALEEARERFQDTRIISPATGVITTLSVERGQIIASGISNVGGGTTLMTISDLSRIFIEVKVDETDIGSVAVGQPCIITADAYPGHEFSGRVERIAPQGVDEQNIVTFQVRVEVDPEDEDPLLVAMGGSDEPGAPERRQPQLLPNMTANVEIITADLRDAILVPNEAIQRDSDGESFVYVLSSGEAASPVNVAGLASGEQASGEVRGRREGRGQGRWSGQRPEGFAGQEGGRPGGARAGSFSGQPGSAGAGNRTRPGGGGSFAGRSPEAPGLDRSAALGGLPAVRRPVTLGPSDGVHTQVTRGLTADEEIVIPIPDWLLRFRSQGAPETDERTRQRARRMMM